MTKDDDLSTMPWLPFPPKDGGPVRLFGVRDALLQAHELGDVHDDSPLVNVAATRMCLAILRRCCLPATPKEWLALRDADRFPTDKVTKYLDSCRDRWHLFDEKFPWFQQADFSTDEPVSVSRLATEAASGNNATLFDHRADSDLPAYTAAEAARMLLAAQSFALGFGKASSAKIGDTVHARPYSADAVCLRGVTVWLSGASWFETLLFNLVHDKANQDDLPAWERDGASELMDEIIGGKRETEPPRGPSDRFTWQSRLVRLIPEMTDDGQVVVRQMFFTQGRSADKTNLLDFDPMKAYRKDRTADFVPVSLGAQKAAWRDAHALLGLESGDFKRPDALDHIAQRVRAGDVPRVIQFNLNVVGLATAPNKAGKFLLWRHDRMPVSAALLDDPDLVERLGLLLSEADETPPDKTGGKPDGGVARQLRQRTEWLCRLLLAPNADVTGGRAPDPRDVARLADDIDPRGAYWARLERHFHDLLLKLPDDWDSAAKWWREEQPASEAWRQAAEREARRAMLEACRELGYTSDARASTRVISAMARVSAYFICGRRNERRSAQGDKMLADLAEDAVRTEEKGDLIK